MPIMQAPRAGSRKAIVFHAFVQGGLPQAEKVGAEQHLKAGTVRSWCGSWSKQGADDKTRPRPARMGSLQGYFTKDPDKERFTIVEEGNEQSIIQWPSGQRDCVVNEWVTKV